MTTKTKIIRKRIIRKPILESMFTKLETEEVNDNGAKVTHSFCLIDSLKQK